MTLFRLFSDLHVEFQQFQFDPLPTDKETVCLLAGDIGVVEKPAALLDLLQRACNQFKKVVYVFGNHEFYGGGSLVRAHQKLRQCLDHYHLYNLHVLENDSVVIDDIAIVGATLWTDFGCNPLVAHQAEGFMNDYRQTRTGTQQEPYRYRLRADHTANKHAFSRKYIFDEVKHYKQEGKKVLVVVHHGVSDLSIADRFRGHPMNGAYVSNLFDCIADTHPDVVVHGHVHEAKHYMIENTHVYVNPRGYPGENTGFDPILTFSL